MNDINRYVEIRMREIKDMVKANKTLPPNTYIISINRFATREFLIRFDDKQTLPILKKELLELKLITDEQARGLESHRGAKQYVITE